MVSKVVSNSQGLMVNWAAHSWRLLPQRAVFWSAHNTLIITDLHLGKSAHFRANGIATPPQLIHGELQRLDDLVQAWAPQQLLILGDLFHSTYNHEWELFANWICAQQGLQCTLVLGNHDLLAHHHYTNCGVVATPLHMEGGVTFKHYPLTEGQTAPAETFLMSGHLHPGYRLRGKGRQLLRLSCFAFGQQQAVLPAFGSFTGLADVNNLAADCYVIAGEEVLSVKA